MKMQARPIGLTECVQRAQNAPCSEQIIALATAELAEGNILLELRSVGLHPSETYYLCQFKYRSKTLTGLGRERRKYNDPADGEYYEYECRVFSDKTGAVEVRFGCDWEVTDAVDKVTSVE